MYNTYHSGCNERSLQQMRIRKNDDFDGHLEEQRWRERVFEILEIDVKLLSE